MAEFGTETDMARSISPRVGASPQTVTADIAMPQAIAQRVIIARADGASHPPGALRSSCGGQILRDVDVTGAYPSIGDAQLEAKLTDATTPQKKLFDAIDGRTVGEIATEHRHRVAGGLAHRVLAGVGFEAEDALTAQEDVGRGGSGWGYPLTGRHLLALSGLLLGAVLGTPAHAQEAPLTAAQELAKDARNPFAEFVKLPVQFTTGFGVGPRHRAGESINVQPVLPLSLSAEWDLIFRPSVTATYLPSPEAQFGLEDLQASLFLTPAGATKWIWGLGPIVQPPTATTDELGTGRWSAGPTGALIYSSGPWLSGVLSYHLASFAGDRHRSSVNQTYIEPQVSYSFASGWYVQCDPALTYDWTADSADAWSIPMGADIGDALTIGAQAMSFQLGVYDFLKRPDGGPEWLMRAQVTLLFPARR